MAMTRAKTSSSEAPTLLPTSAYGWESMGKCDWISFKMARSRASKGPVFGFRFSVFGIVIRKSWHLGMRYYIEFFFNCPLYMGYLIDNLILFYRKPKTGNRKRY
jgi:hypothetical protein